jgi:hypothetical protein
MLGVTLFVCCYINFNIFCILCSSEPYYFASVQLILSIFNIYSTETRRILIRLVYLIAKLQTESSHIKAETNRYL